MWLCHCEGIVRSNPLDISKEIASGKYIAIANNCILATNDTNHFERIEGLHIQDWLKTNI